MYNLTDKQTLVLGLYYYDGFSCPEIAEQLSVSRQAVDDIRHAGLKKLKAAGIQIHRQPKVTVTYCDPSLLDKMIIK